MAARASVEFYVGLALKARGARQVESGKKKGGKSVEKEEGEGGVMEEAFVIRAFRNGLGVFVSKYVWPVLGFLRSLAHRVIDADSASRVL
jgi:exosome complex exonuclease DIS3/RRP44